MSAVCAATFVRWPPRTHGKDDATPTSNSTTTCPDGFGGYAALSLNLCGRPSRRDALRPLKGGMAGVPMVPVTAEVLPQCKPA